MLRRLLGRAVDRGNMNGPPPTSVSVVVPLFNHAAYVDDAICSALAEGDRLHELIIVDDGSTDESARVARARAAGEPRVIIWSQPNRGAHAALNAGIARATSAYVAILNSDDAYLPGRLESLSAALDADPSAWMATSAIEFIDAAGLLVTNPWHETALAFAERSPDIGITLLNGNIFVTTSNFLIRRDAVDQVGLFAPLRYAHDLDFALRLLLMGGRIAQIETKLLRYRLHAANTISEDHHRVRIEWAMAAGAYLLGMSDRAGEGCADYKRLRALLAVLEEHRILQGATLCAAYMRGHPPSTLAHNPITRDEAFRDTLADCV